ncbi:MAG TPA: HIT family protein [Syntrophomonadaceae bacterium]|nr:HIT family protein [Syntrophomonadaceae bacterium]
MICPFCSPILSEVITTNDYAYALFDKYPINLGHILIIPKRHVESYFDTTQEERKAMDKLLEECKDLLDKEYAPDGYNIGINVGESAGQTIFHVHVHLMPRYTGDIDNPRGGVRGVIPEKRIY